MPDGQMYHLLTLGQKNMASYASQVERADRWKVIRHIRALQEPPPEPPEQAPLLDGAVPADGAPESGLPETGISDPDTPDPDMQNAHGEDAATTETPETEGLEP
jgi:hypothetical protein